MKTCRSQRYVVIALLLSFSSVNAQDFFRKMEEDNANFYEIQKEAEAYFENRDKGKGSGYKQYKRWEAASASHVQEDGRLQSKETRRAVFLAGRKESRAFSGDWKELGPVSVTPGAGRPGVGRLTAIAISEQNSNLIFVGSPTGGLWKSNNGGQSWTPKGDQFADMQIWSIAIDPRNSNIVYVGNGSGEILMSTNQGDSFDVLYDVDGGGRMSEILIHPNNSNIIHVASFSRGIHKGVYIEAESRWGWTPVLEYDENDNRVGIEDIAYKPNSDYQTMYACGNKFFKSVNGGDSWSSVTDGIKSNSRMRLAVTPADNDVLYAVQVIPNGGQSVFGYLYKYDSDENRFHTVIDHTAGINLTGVQSRRDLVIAINPNDANRILVGGLVMYELIQTPEGLATIQRCTTLYSNSHDKGGNMAYIHADIQELLFHDSKLYACTDGGIYRSDDQGTHFTDLSEGLGITQIYEIANSSLDKNQVLIATQDNGVNLMSTSARTWKSVSNADGFDCAFHRSNSNIIFGNTQYGSLFASMNGGLTRVDQHNLEYPEDLINGKGILDQSTLELDYHYNGKVYLAYKDVYRHDNLAVTGQEWVNISEETPFEDALSNSILQLELSEASSDVMFVATKGHIFRGTNIKSNEADWERLNSKHETRINDIACDPFDKDRVVYVTSAGKVQVSKDLDEKLWDDVSEGLTDGASITSVALDRSSNKGIYVAMDGSIFFRNDLTNGWIPFSTNLPNVQIKDIDIYYGAPGEARLRVGTFGRGLWETPLYDDKEDGDHVCTNVVSDFPYTQSFETGFGNWRNLTTDQVNWTVKKDATPSTGTGPTNAYNGLYYIYMETSNANNPSKNAVIESECFSLKDVDNPEIRFRYNMYGADMGKLTLYVSHDGYLWDELWSMEGNQGTSWKEAAIGLNEYASKNVKFRFKATSGSGWRSDIALDYVRVQEQSIPCGVVRTSFPYFESFESGFGGWMNELSADVEWTRHKGSTNSGGTGPTSAANGEYYMYMEVSGANHPSKTAILKSECLDLTKTTNPKLFFRYHMYGSDMGDLKLQISANGSSWETIWSKAGDQGNSWKTALLDLYDYSDARVRLRFFATSGDDYKGDIAIDYIDLYNQIDCDKVITSLPYSEGFESGLGDWKQGSLNAVDWTRRTNGTPSAGTGPDKASEGDYYMYMETSAPNYPSKNAYLESPCFNFNLTATPFMSFDYQMLGKNVESLILQATTNGGGWKTIWERTGDQGTKKWKQASVNLSQYGNKTTRFRFRAKSGTSWQGDICVDNIQIGISPEPQRDNCLSLDLMLNDTPEGALWEIAQYGEKIESSADYSDKGAGDMITDRICLPIECYELTIKGEVQNYTIRDLNDNVLLKGVDLEGPVVCEVCNGKVTVKDELVSSAELNKETILVFPNPAKEQLNVQMPSNGDDVRVQLIDLAGRIILDQVFNTSTGMNLFKMDVSEYANGSYMLLLSRGESMVKERVIIQD